MVGIGSTSGYLDDKALGYMNLDHLGWFLYT